MTNGVVMETLLMGIADVLLLATETGSAADVVPSSTCPKLKVDGVSVTTPTAAPVPFRSTVSWPP